MAVPTASPYDTITADLWNSLAGLVNGTTGYGNPILATAINSDSFWSITARNQGSLGQALRVQNAAGNANLLSVADAGVVIGNTPLKAISHNSSSVYGVQIQNVATSQTKTMNVLNAEGTTSLFNIQRSSDGRDTISMNKTNAQVPVESFVLIADSPGTLTPYLVSDTVLNSAGTGKDHGAGRFIADQRDTNGANLIRALEARTRRIAPAVTAGTWVMEGNLTTDVTGAGVTSNVGIYMAAGSGLAGEVRCDTAYLALGTVGWKQPFLALDTDNTTQIFKIDQTGRVHTVLGTASLPAFTFVADPNTGMYSNGADNLAFATAGTLRAIFDQLGNHVVGGSVATNATDGFLYLPTCAGTPTGTPTTYGGRIPMVIDSSNHKAYIYSGATWVALN